MFDFISCILFGIFFYLYHCYKMDKLENEILASWNEDMVSRDAGLFELQDAYEQDRLDMFDQIGQRDEKIFEFEQEHIQLGEEIRAHKELCLPRLHEIRQEREIAEDNIVDAEVVEE